jgi:hypothetical protein
MKKNISGQKIGVQMVSATDGSAFTGSVTVAVTGDAETQATGSVGSGACAHEGNGYHTYAPSQPETNYDLIAFTFTGSGAVPATVQVYTLPTTGILAPTTADRTLDTNASGHVSRVTLTDTLTTYTGNTPQTGDCYPKIDTEVATIITNIAALNNLSAAQVNAEVLDVIGTDTLVAGVTIKEALRRQGALLSGKVTNAGTGTETFKDYAESASTIVITVDSSGNRSSITYN